MDLNHRPPGPEP